MTTARILGAAMPLLLLTAAIAVFALLHAEHRATRRREARQAEQRARPPCPGPCRAVLDELELHRAATKHACCPGWWTPAHTYAHHPDCTKENA